MQARRSNVVGGRFNRCETGLTPQGASAELRGGGRLARPCNEGTGSTQQGVSAELECGWSLAHPRNLVVRRLYVYC